MNRILKFRVWDCEIKSFVGKDLDVNECNFADGVIFQQFTELKDSTGKDIYEGDIVQCFRWDENNTKYLGGILSMKGMKKNITNWIY